MTAAALSAPLPRSRREIWCIGGGKGGIGKSLLTASLGWTVARMGRRVVLMDMDLGGANLHTCLGVPPPVLTLGDFIRRRVEKIDDVAVETSQPCLRLISGASDLLLAANITYQQKMRILNKIRSLDVDIVLIDLGAGTSLNILDFFLLADQGILTVVPEPTSIENGYRFIKSALFRRLRRAAGTPIVREIVDTAFDQKNPLGIKSPLDLLAAVEREDAAEAETMRREMAAFQPRFVVNQVRSPVDASVGHQLVQACARHLGVRATYAGYVDYDDAVWRCVRQRRLFVEVAPRCPAAMKVSQLARGLLDGDSLSLMW
jgi:flagellar biosynthesis protein FlhG